jgi:myo-inositol-1(or 4)-monophosphatase
VLALDAAGASTAHAKEGRDVVTATDIAVEDLMRAELEAAFPYPVAGEERGGEVPTDGSPYWLIDPICGTRNYASGSPMYCVNLALIEDGAAVTVAAAGDASRGEVVYAERGSGAWSLKDGANTSLNVSEESRTIVVEEGKSSGEPRAHAARFMAQVVRADRWDFRSLGSTVAMAYLAAGRVAAYVVFHVTDVHAAAGSLLVAEAGGVLTDLDGEPWSLRSQSLLFAATPALHDALLRLARETRIGDGGPL